MKLIDKDLENPPTFTGEDEDLEEDFLESYQACRLVFVVLVYVVVLGIGFSTLTFRGTEEENTSLNRGLLSMDFLYFVV